MYKTEILVRLFNVGLRGITLASKFVLIFMLAKYLSPSSVGMYGLLLVTVAYSMYPLGFEFYTFSSRELVNGDVKERAQKLKNQISLHAVLYVIVMPFLLLLFVFELLPWNFAPYFIVLVLLEHLNQESMRLLVALQYQLIASLALFLRQGVWALILVVLMFFDTEFRQLKYVLVAWILGGGLALFLSVYVLVKITNLNKHQLKKIEWHWVFRGLMVALPLFAAALSSNFITTIDRYWFAVLQGDMNLGAYVFYMSIAAAMVTFMDAGVFSFLYPRLLAFHAKKDRVGFFVTMKNMIHQVVIVSLVFSVAAIFLSKSFFSLLGNEVYLQNIDVFYILIFMVVLQVFGYIPHYGLYAQGKDKQIVISSLLSVPIFIGSGFLLLRYNSMYAIPVALCIVYGFVLIYKACAYYSSSTAVKVVI